MTPEEKAEQIIEAMYNAIPCIPSDIGVSGPPNLYAKQCATIAVDEILNDYSIFNEKHKAYKVPSFWQQVKEAIANL